MTVREQRVPTEKVGDHFNGTPRGMEQRDIREEFMNMTGKLLCQSINHTSIFQNLLQYSTWRMWIVEEAVRGSYNLRHDSFDFQIGLNLSCIITIDNKKSRNTKIGNTRQILANVKLFPH